MSTYAELISPIIYEYNNIGDIAEAINYANDPDEILGVAYYGGTYTGDGDSLAGQYAYDAATSNPDVGMNPCVDELSAHLDCLIECDAKFDYAKALNEAVRIRDLLLQEENS